MSSGLLVKEREKLKITKDSWSQETTNALGGTVIGDAASIQVRVERMYAPSINRLVNHPEHINLPDQLKVMGDLLNQLGEELPELTENQANSLEETAEAWPGYCVVPVPLYQSLSEREAFLDKVSQYLKSQYYKGQEYDWSINGSQRYGTLLSHPGEFIVDWGCRKPLPESAYLSFQEADMRRHKAPDISHHLCYQSLSQKDGKIYKEPHEINGYIDSLKKLGMCVEAKDGKLWVFPLIDINPGSNKKTGDDVTELYDTVSPVATVESLVIVQLMHQLANSKSKETRTYISNESVCRLHDCAKLVPEPIGISCGPDGCRIELLNWYSDARESHCTVLKTVSGLRPITDPSDSSD